MLYNDVEVYQNVYDDLLEVEWKEEVTNMHGQIIEDPYLIRLVRYLRTPSVSMTNYKFKKGEEVGGSGF